MKVTIDKVLNKPQY